MGAEVIAVLPTTLVSGESKGALDEPTFKLHGSRTAITGPEIGEDESLIRLVAEGDQDAIVTLFRRHGVQVRHVALRILRDEGEADDLLQDLFLFLSYKASVYDPRKSSGKSWIIQMAYQRALERRRHLKRRNFYCAESLDPDRQPSRYFESEDVSLQRIDGSGLLRKYRSRLSEDQQRVLNLHFFEGHDFREIAEVTGQTLPTVRSHYYRALKKLRTEIAKRETQKS